jgi:hypothetical protein
VPAAGVRVENRTPYPTSVVRSVVRRHMRGTPRHPRLVVVGMRRGRSDDRQGFTPFNDALPIRIWLDPPSRYPQAGARSWWEELGLTAGHEDWHLRHPHEPCRDGGCERRAESHGHREWRTRRP